SPAFSISSELVRNGHRRKPSPKPTASSTWRCPSTLPSRRSKMSPAPSDSAPRSRRSAWHHTRQHLGAPSRGRARPSRRRSHGPRRLFHPCFGIGGCSLPTWLPCSLSSSRSSAVWLEHPVGSVPPPRRRAPPAPAVAFIPARHQYSAFSRPLLEKRRTRTLEIAYSKTKMSPDRVTRTPLGADGRRDFANTVTWPSIPMRLTCPAP